MSMSLRARTAAVVAAAALMVAAAASGAAATYPKPGTGQVPGLASVGGGAVTPHLRIFYRTSGARLNTITDGVHADLGGVLTSGPAVVTSTVGEFFGVSVFARGADDAIWYRVFSDGTGEWARWQSMGGQSLGAPGATCVGAATGPTIVYVRGTDRALWRKPVDGAWSRLGGVLISDPAALAPYGGTCPTVEDVFALGTDGAVYEHLRGVWRRIGGKSTVAPAAVQLPGGATVLFVRGTDNALFTTTRAAGATTWAPWHRVGGILSSAPTATVFPTAPRTLTVMALGADRNLWQGSSLTPTGTWTWNTIP